MLQLFISVSSQAGYSPKILATQRGSIECLILLGLSFDEAKFAVDAFGMFTAPPAAWSLRHTWSQPSLSSEYARVRECECTRWALFELVRSVGNLCTPSLALYALLVVRIYSPRILSH